VTKSSETVSDSPRTHLRTDLWDIYDTLGHYDRCLSASTLQLCWQLHPPRLWGNMFHRKAQRLLWQFYEQASMRGLGPVQPVPWWPRALQVSRWRPKFPRMLVLHEWVFLAGCGFRRRDGLQVKMLGGWWRHGGWHGDRGAGLLLRLLWMVTPRRCWKVGSYSIVWWVVLETKFKGQKLKLGKDERYILTCIDQLSTSSSLVNIINFVVTKVDNVNLCWPKC
jgi:hypothetical protein